MTKAIYGEDCNHFTIANSYSNIGNTYQSLGDYPLALKYYTEALRMTKTIHGERSDDTVSSQNIANKEEGMGNFSKQLDQDADFKHLQKENEEDIQTAGKHL